MYEDRSWLEIIAAIFIVAIVGNVLLWGFFWILTEVGRYD